MVGVLRSFVSNFIELSIMMHYVSDYSNFNDLHGCCFPLHSTFYRGAHSDGTPGINVKKPLETEKSWDGVLYKEYPKGTPQLSVVKIVVAPNTSLAWHEHLIPNAAYVLNGVLIVEKKATGEKRLLKTGDVLPEMVDSAHRGYTGKEGVTLVVFYAGQKGIPLSKPAE